MSRFATVDSLQANMPKGAGYAAPANLFLGMISDLQEARSLAVAFYERAIKLSEKGETRRLARKYLETPYSERR